MKVIDAEYRKNANMEGIDTEYGTSRCRIWKVWLQNMTGIHVFAKNGFLNVKRYRFRKWKVQMQDMEGTDAEYGRYKCRIWKVRMQNMEGVNSEYRTNRCIKW
jgi:hypothetical protein